MPLPRLVRPLALLCGGVLLFVAGLEAGRRLPRGAESPPVRGVPAAPADLYDAARAARKAGLEWTGDSPSGRFLSAVLVAEGPVPAEEVASTRLTPGSPAEAWRGRVRVWLADVAGSHISPPDGAERWGGVYLYGDPQLIRRLKSA